jgi:hypothetical protein
MNVIERAKRIILQPRETWPVIEAEATSVRSLYLQYLLWLALIPAVCAFIGMSLIGVSAFGVTVRVPLLSGLVNLLVSYVLSVAGIYVLGLIVDLLAPTFGGTRNALQAQKLVVYASTAALLAGVFSLLPMLSMLGLLAALYSLYLIYTGLPVLMKNAAEKSLPYMAVVVVAALVLSVVMGAITSLWASRAMPMAGSGQGGVSVSTANGQISLDTAQLEAARKKVEEATRKMEQAQNSQDPKAMAEATGQAVAAAAGALGGAQDNLPASALRAALPEQLGGLPRTEIRMQDGSAVGMPMNQASAEYTAGDKLLRLEIVDLGALSGLAQMAGMVQSEKETDGRVEKVQRVGQRTVHESYEKDGTHSQIKTVLTNGVVVELEGDNLPIADLRALMGKLDLAALEALQRKPKS